MMAAKAKTTKAIGEARLAAPDPELGALVADAVPVEVVLVLEALDLVVLEALVVELVEFPDVVGATVVDEEPLEEEVVLLDPVVVVVADALVEADVLVEAVPVVDPERLEEAVPPVRMNWTL
jgi:hypothetical protein